jgi:hypothetical protein
MPVWGWIIIGVVAVAVAAVAGWLAYSARRRKQLQEHFGTEYDRAVAEQGGRREADAELARREKRREELDIQPLAAEDRTRYRDEWQRVQAEFVDAPEEAVSDADKLVSEVMRQRGYPMEDFESRAADVSVDHPDVVNNYREAHRIAEMTNNGGASTEALRKAMIHYRALFAELVEAGEPQGR